MVLLVALAVAAGVRPAAAQAGFPNIPVWSYPGAFRQVPGGDSIIEARPRTLTVRWLRDPAAEARPDFGGYRIYRATNVAGIEDTTNKLVLVRRFSKQFGDSIFTWHFPRIDASTDSLERIATFIDPDSSGRFVKVCRLRRPQNDPNGACLSRGDSVFVLIPPPGPHDGFRTWYSITYEARNTTDNDYLDLFMAGPFGDRRDLGNVTGPRSVAIGDVDGDKVADLAVASSTTGTVTIDLGDGSGAFRRKGDVPVGTGPRAVAIADLDHDDHADLAVVNQAANTVSLLFGDGTGSFGGRTDLDVGAGPVALVVADLNNDGRLDIATANSLEATVSILLGSAGRTFVRLPDVATIGLPSDLASKDVNGDRKLDLVLGIFNAGGLVLYGTGTGTFDPGPGLGGGPGSNAVVVADLNGDGRLEILVGSAGNGELWMYTVQSGGTILQIGQATVGTSIADLAAADFDADGAAELVMANPLQGRLAVRYYDAGLDTRQDTYLPLQGTPVSVATGNLDGRGLADLAVADSSANLVSVFLGPQNLNHKAANVSNDVWQPREASANPDSHFFARAIEPTGGPTANLSRVAVIPNPYRAVEAWNPGGGHEVHFINLPAQARIHIYTLSGDLVRVMQHADPVRDFERWDLKNEAGRDVSSGVYMYRVEAESFAYQNRFVVIR